MIIVLKREATQETAQEILAKIEAKGLKPLYMPGSERVVLGALGDERVLAELGLDSHPMVESLKPILSPYKLVSREMHPHDTIVRFGKANIGGVGFAVIAGPCAVETEDQAVADKADMLQVGARNMQNYSLLKALGKVRKPVLLKRGLAAKVEELLLAAEYLLAAGNEQVILCERGIRTFETTTRNTLDLNAVAYMKLRTHLPVLVDPSHGTGVRDLVVPMSLAAAACGADGILVEVHENPVDAWSDGAQSLYPHQFETLMSNLASVLAAVGRELA